MTVPLNVTEHCEIIKNIPLSYIYIYNKSAIVQLYSGENKLIFNNKDDDEICFVLGQHADLDLYSAGSLKQQSAGIHVAPLGHIILILSPPVFTISS